ncbi:MAG: hypothetical protein JAY74_11610 [Candidatus Thiodiazotropha taylori]|nr:hypothetical protein [Candidatus Thiodiazotropha taylori]
MNETKISRKLCFLLKDGEVVFPCTMKNTKSNTHTFRVSRHGGNILNDADPKKREDEATEEEMVKYVLELGYCTRVLKSNGDKNIYSPNSSNVVCVYVPK